MTTSRQGPRSSQYLPTEAVQVLHPAGPVLALVPGKRETFRVEHTGDAWRCSCRAETASCGHIQAVKRVVVLAAPEGGSELCDPTRPDHRQPGFLSPESANTPENGSDR